MMKMILSLALILALSSTAGALQCQTCVNEECSRTALIPCSSETMCVTAAIQATTSGTSAQQIYKACALSSLCPSAETLTYSVNLGDSGAVASAKCCNTDDCNRDTLPFPGTQTPNSLQCNSCSTPECNTAVQCKGEEDRCFKASVTSGSTTSSAFGCASTNLCTAAAALGSLPFLQSVGNVSGSSCCDTSLCNTLTVTTTPTPTTTTPAPTTTTPTPTTTTASPTTTTASPTTTTPAPTTTTPTPTTTTASPTTTTASPTTTTPAPTTTIAAPTTTTAAPTTTTASPTTTTPSLTTTTAALTTTDTLTTTAAPTTTTTALTTTTPLTTTTGASSTTTAAACCVRLVMIHLLLGLLIFTSC